MIRSKRALAVAATAVTAGLVSSTAATATSVPPGTDAAPAGSEAAEGRSSYITLEEACAEYDGLEAPDGFRVNLVTDIGKVDDGTFNQFAYDGMMAAVECFGIEESDFIETVSESDYAANIATSLEGQPDVVITVGFLLTDDTKAAAEANPDINFIGVDQYLDEYPPNMAGEQFAEDQAGYLAGVIAASLSETGVIGVVGGLETVPPVVKLVNGYTVGAQSVNPDINVLSVYLDSFTDPATGASTANQFIGEGADVIFGAGGQTGSGGVAAAAEQGVWGIGVDQDEYYTTFAGGSAAGSEYLASSAVKRVDLSTFQLIAAAVAGEFQGGLYIGDAANNQVAFAPPHDADVPDEVIAAAEEALAGLADGSITTGLCGIDGLFIGEGSACDGAAGDGDAAAGSDAADEATATTGG